MYGKLEFLQTGEASVRCFNRCGKGKKNFERPTIKMPLFTWSNTYLCGSVCLLTCGGTMACV